MSISNKEELQFLLHRAWEIERKFESLSSWKGFVSIGQTFRPTVLTLARDSYMHRLKLETLMKTLDFEEPTNEIPDGTFDFEGMLDSEAINKIVQNDELVRDLYTRIVESTDPKLVSALCAGKDVDFFYQTIKEMVDDETKHINMVRTSAGRIHRIQ